MIFSLVSSAQEWLNVKWDEHKKEIENKEMEKVKAFEEAEQVNDPFSVSFIFIRTELMTLTFILQKRFEGTRVSVETFLTWRNKFEQEMGIAQKREKLSDNKKLTGRELFMRDTTLIDSDLKFLLAAGDSVENVKIDESLFQNMDDLELDSDEDDEDYVPGDESD